MKRLLVINGLLLLILASVAAASYWFLTTYTGWLANEVADPDAYRASWQAKLDELALEHPAVIHYQPKSCLCRAFAAGHLRTLGSLAEENGFARYQLNTKWPHLGTTLNLAEHDTSIAPIVLITNPSGHLAYLGAYSNGVTCTKATSQIDQLIASPNNLPQHTQVGLNVSTCRCLSL